MPGVTIATDLILGFPTETEQDFERSLQLVEHNKFPSLFINQFYPRPGTPAARMDLIPAKDVKKRTRRMTELFQSYMPYSDRIGRIYTVLVSDIASDTLNFVGHNEFYEQVLVPKREEYLGQCIEVEIISFGKFFMVGKVLKDYLKPKNRLLSVNLINLFKNDLIKFNLMSTTTICLMVGLTIYYLKYKKG